MALGSCGGGVVTLLGGCRCRVVSAQANPSGAAMMTSKITGRMTASRYATRCGRWTAGCWTGGRCGETGAGAGSVKGCAWGGDHLGSTLDMYQGFEAAVQVPSKEGRCHPACFLRHMISHLAGIGPPALEQCSQQNQCLWSRPRRSGRAAALAYGTA